MKVLIFSLVLLAIGIACIALENTFYQFIDERGLLHESLFLPFGAISVLLGGVGLVYVLAKTLMSKGKKR